MIDSLDAVQRFRFVPEGPLARFDSWEAYYLALDLCRGHMQRRMVQGREVYTYQEGLERRLEAAGLACETTVVAGSPVLVVGYRVNVDMAKAHTERKAKKVAPLR